MILCNVQSSLKEKNSLDCIVIAQEELNNEVHQTYVIMRDINVLHVPHCCAQCVICTVQQGASVAQQITLVR